MKISKGILAAIMVVVLSATGVTAFAATGGPAEAAAGVTGRTLESVVAEHVDQNKTYGMIAKEAGRLDAFKAEMLKVKRAQLDAKVNAGTMTKEQADEIYAAIEKKQVNCDGAGQAGIGRAMGANFGKGQSKGGVVGVGYGKGQGEGGGVNAGGGFGQGGGMRDGSCLK